MPKQELKKPPEKSVKLSKAQLRKIPELCKFYKIVHEYALREEAYAVALETYIHLKKNKK